MIKAARFFPAGERACSESLFFLPPSSHTRIQVKINSKIDTGELETEHENLKKQLRQVLGAKNRLGQQMDNLDISDKMYDRKYQDMQDRLNGLYDEIERLESLIDDIVSRKVRICL